MKCVEKKKKKKKGKVNLKLNAYVKNIVDNKKLYIYIYIHSINRQKYSPFNLGGSQVNLLFKELLDLIFRSIVIWVLKLQNNV